MMYIPNIDDCLKILTDEEVKDFAVINFSEYFKDKRKAFNDFKDKLQKCMK